MALPFSLSLTNANSFSIPSNLRSIFPSTIEISFLHLRAQTFADALHHYVNHKWNLIKAG
jgi:hypothetical protein